MRKYLVLLLISYILGILISDYVSLLWSLVYIGIPLIIIFAFALFKKMNMRMPTYILALLFGIIITHTIGAFSVVPYMEHIGVKEDVTCQVVGPPVERYNYTSYEVRFIEDSKRIGGKILLNVDNLYSGKVYSYGQTLLIRNAEIEAYNSAKRQSYMAKNAYFASINTADYNIHTIPEVKISSFLKMLFGFRQSVVDVCDKYLPDDVSQIVKAITVGDKSSLLDEINSYFTVSGLSHILAISGFHLSMLVMYVSYLFSGIKKKYKKYILILVRIFICVSMMLITGFQPSVVRSSVMFIIMSLSTLVKREYDSFTALIIAGGIIVLQNPYSLYDAGFLLSFFATLGIILFFPKISKFLNKKAKILGKYIIDLLSVSISAQIAVFPIVAVAFNKVQIFSVLSNIVASPIFSLLYASSIAFIVVAHIIPMFLPVFSGLVFVWCRALIYLVKLISMIPFAQVDVTGVYFIMRIIVIVAIVLALYSMMKSKNNHIKAVSGLLVCVLITSLFYIKGNPSDLKVTFLDVGQGDCAIIEVSDKTVIIDGGTSGDTEVGEMVIKPYLLENGISKIDYAFISHYHEDHYSGILYLMDNFKIDKLILSGASNKEDEDNKQLILETANRNDIPIYYFYDGDAVKLSDNAVITAYSPLRNIWYSSNDESLVLKLDANGKTFLFTGDIEKSGENKILTKNLSADVLKVAHHGSESSSTDAFLSNALPKYAVISCGKNNMYKHPHAQVLERLDYIGAKIYRTDVQGNIVFSVSKNGKISVK